MDELDKLAVDWQDTIDLMAQIVNVPSGLIMRFRDGELEVFISSKTGGNPYTVGEKEVMDGSGLYCERVIKSNRMLKVPNALADDEWKDNPDVELNMISYLGYPISWPDGTIFGTICVLDNKENFYTERYEHLVSKFRSLIEKQLEIIDKNKLLKKFAEIDFLTDILNRRALLSRGQAEFERSMRYGRPMSVLMFDIDKFKNINDTFGHRAGDEVLKTFAGFIASLLRTSDVWGRYGGEEFIAVLSETDYKSALLAADRFRKKIEALKVEADDAEISFTVSIGVGALENTQGLAEVINRADEALYRAKAAGRNCVR